MTWKDYAYGGLLMAALVAAGFMLRCTTKPKPPKPGECVPNVPRVVLDGKMKPDLWWVYYRLGYAGKRENSGEACTVWRRVTKSEYERRMYGERD